jgi:hypothetical protein
LDRPRYCAVLFLINRGTLLVKPLLVLLFSRIAHDGCGYTLYFFFSFIPKLIEAACLNVVLIDIAQDIIADAEKFRMVAPKSIIYPSPLTHSFFFIYRFSFYLFYFLAMNSKTVVMAALNSNAHAHNK